VPAPVLAVALGNNDAVWFLSRTDGVESLYRLD
jgi:hypothetical protein